MTQNSNTLGDINLKEFTRKLRSKDDSYAQLSKGLQIFYWILVFMYSILVVRNIIANSSLQEIFASISFLLGMFIFALLFRHYYKEYKFVDYSLPTLVMLKKAAYRYKPFQVKTLWALVGVLFIDAGLTLNTVFGGSIMIIQMVFLGTIAVSLMIGLMIWRTRYKPLRDNALLLISEINGEN